MDDEYGIISNSDALDEDYLPPNIPGREGQIKELAYCLRPAMKKKQPIHVWLHGKPGTGKTTVTKYVLSQLVSHSSAKSVYVNCWENSTYYSVTDRIINDLRILMAEKLSSAFKLQRLEEHLKDNPLVSTFSPGDVESGGDGVTITYLKV